MKPISKLTLCALGAILTGAMFFERGPDPVIFPEQTVPVYFNHDYHVRKPDEAKGVTGEGLSCTFCHGEISDSVRASDRDIPGHDSCDTCHDEWIGDEDEQPPVKECARCHKDLNPTGTSTKAAKLNIPPPNIIFPHAVHVKSNVACTECHSDVPNKKVATRDDYPTMDRCVGCHQDRGVSVECQTCHLKAPSGRILTKFPQGELKPNRYHSFALHDADFLRDHAVPAQRDKAYCQTCHSESDCLQCHDGVARDLRYHPGDWIATHYLRARKDDMRCQSCHRLQTFCIDCHLRSGVATAGSVGMALQRRTIRRNPSGQATGPHPMGPEWVSNVGGRNFHGFHAQRNIRACASCHQEQYCITCHMSSFQGGTVGGNPHGPNPQRLRGSRASKENARVCLKCHRPEDPSWR